MATKIVMAQLSPTMEEGKLLEWKLQEGDAVEAGDVLAEIETDKANMDVESLGSGVLRKIIVQAGATVPVGVLIGVVAEPDEDISSILAAAEAPPAATAAPPSPSRASPNGPTAAAGSCAVASTYRHRRGTHPRSGRTGRLAGVSAPLGALTGLPRPSTFRSASLAVAY